MKGPECCRIDQLTMELCRLPAEWQIWYGETPDDYTEACAAHVGELLYPTKENRVVRLAGRDER